MVRDTVSIPARRRAAGLPRRRALLRRLSRQPGRTPSRSSAPPPRPGSRWSRCATPTAGCCRRRSPTSSATSTTPSVRTAYASASTATTTPAARSPTPCRRSVPARLTCRARSTGTASAPATPTSSRSWPTSSSSSAARCCRTASCARRRGSRTPSPRSPTCRPRRASPTSGSRAFTHKAGLHASAIKVDPDLYQHTDPQGVGNDMRLLVSDMAGRASIELKGRELGFDLADDQELVTRITDRVKDPGGAGLHVRGGRRVVRAAAGRGGRRLAAGVLRRRVVAGDHRVVGDGRGRVRGDRQAARGR